MNKYPAILYGTAWKKQKTATLVAIALNCGFKGIDTACQPKHYNQAGVGQGIALSKIDRDKIFIQTKFTPLSGHDPKRIPYDRSASLSEQVRQSLEISLKNLRTDYIDSLVLHSPLRTLSETLQVWNQFQLFVEKGLVRHLGISNCYDCTFLQQLYNKSKVKPSFIQNRFYAQTNYDVSIRKFCALNGVVYQSFWTLTANPHLLKDKQLVRLGTKYGISPEQVLYVLLIGEGIMPLIGTCSQNHMRQDIQMLRVEIPDQQKKLVRKMING